MIAAIITSQTFRARETQHSGARLSRPCCHQWRCGSVIHSWFSDVFVVVSFNPMRNSIYIYIQSLAIISNIAQIKNFWKYLKPVSLGTHHGGRWSFRLMEQAGGITATGDTVKYLKHRSILYLTCYLGSKCCGQSQCREVAVHLLTSVMKRYEKHLGSQGNDEVSATPSLQFLLDDIVPLHHCVNQGPDQLYSAFPAGCCCWKN